MAEMIMCTGCGELFSLPNPYDKVRRAVYCAECHKGAESTLAQAGEISVRLAAALRELEEMYPEMDFLVGAEIAELGKVLSEWGARERKKKAGECEDRLLFNE